MSASYVSLVSWLLSHAATSELKCDADQPVGSSPFRVLGLQQMVFEGQLGLYVAVVPVRQFTARDLPSKAKVRCLTIKLFLRSFLHTDDNLGQIYLY